MRVLRPGEAVTDEQLVRSIAKGDLESLGELFLRHEPTVRRALGRLGVPRGDVDDVVQATFLQVVRASTKLELQKSPTPARAWILGIAVMMARRHGRSLGRAAKNLVRWAEFQLSHRADAPTPLEITQTKQDVQRLEQALACLSAKKREVFVLITLERMSGDEVAKALGVPINTVWTRLHHARQELRWAVRGGRQ